MPKLPKEVKIISSVLLYECKTWSLTLKEEQRLKTFEIKRAEENIWFIT